MPQLIVIFLLLFAALAFGWFYWQRAKNRGGDSVVTTSEPTEQTQPTEPTDTTPAS